MMATMIALHFQITTDSGARALSFGDADDDDFPDSWFPFLIGLRLPIAAQTTARLASTMAWNWRPLSNVPILSQVLFLLLYWST